MLDNPKRKGEFQTVCHHTFAILLLGVIGSITAQMLYATQRRDVADDCSH